MSRSDVTEPDYNDCSDKELDFFIDKMAGQVNAGMQDDAYGKLLREHFQAACEESQFRYNNGLSTDYSWP